MAMVPLLVINTMVMIAMSSSGTSLPPMSRENTLLGLGHVAVVDIRTFMYEVRKHEKMNVSLSRKIHIIALPHGTGNTCLSPDQSAVTPSSPSLGVDCGSTNAFCAMRLDPQRQVDNSKANITNQIISKKCQYTVQSSMLRRTSMSSAPRDLRRISVLSHTPSPPSKCKPRKAVNT